MLLSSLSVVTILGFIYRLLLLLNTRISTYRPTSVLFIPLQPPITLILMPGLNNLDILLEIMAVSRREDRAHLMAASRALYSHGARFLLREPPHIETQQQLLSFLAFLSAQTDVRSKFLRHLELSPLYSWSTPACVRLADALSRIHTLQSLTISGRYYGCLADPELISALAALPSLQELRVHSYGLDCLDLLKTLRAQVRRLIVDCPAYYNENIFNKFADDDEWTAHHPIVVLEHSAPTLEELSISCWSTHPDPEVAPSPNIIYPRMHTLSIKYGSLPVVLPLIRAYPNLEHLSFDFRYASPDEIEEYRLCNLNQQILAGCTWRHLRAFAGDLADLYVLGLTCAIERVTLRTPAVYLGWPGTHRLGPTMVPVLTKARPRSLELDGWLTDVRGPRGDGKFAMFRGEGASRLETLTVEGHLEGMEHVDVDVCAVLISRLERVQVS